MIDFATLQGLDIPEGVVTLITDNAGRILWSLGGPAVLEVKKITSDTYSGGTTRPNEEFILLDIYPKPNGKVRVTYGGVQKPISDTSGTAEPSAQQVFFGTFKGASDSVATPSSGTLMIEGDCAAFSTSSYNISKDDTTYCRCVIGIEDTGSATSIPQFAFENNSLLTSVVLGKNLKTIGKRAFGGCTNLNNVELGENLESIGDSAFDSCTSLSHIHIPASVKSISYSSFNGTNLSNVSIDPNNKTYSTDGALLLNKDGKELITALVKVSGSYTIPNGVESIGEQAFYNNAITSVNFPASLTSVGSSAFAYNELQSITVPTTVKTWGSRAFLYNPLTSVTIPQGAVLGERMFEDCRALTSMSIPSGILEIPKGFCDGCSSLTSLSLPEGLTVIGEDAFSGGNANATALTYVTIPSTVTKIGNSAFYGLASSAKKIFHFLSTTPPNLGGTHALGNGSYTVSQIIVPKGCAEAYKSAFGTTYADKITEEA